MPGRHPTRLYRALARSQGSREGQTGESGVGGRNESPITPSLFESRDQRVIWLKRLWSRSPLFVKPNLYFIKRYFLRAGFLDGKEGFIFHFLQAYWYRLLVDINLDEIRNLSGDKPPQQ